MYRFLLRPKWLLFHVAILGLVYVMINLGFWQLRRLDQRQAFNATIEARYDEPPVPLDELLPEGFTDYASIEWRPVTVSGVYDTAGVIHIVNRSQNNAAGDNIVMPMKLADGRTMFINRGFVPLNVNVPPAPEGPDGEVQLVGRLRQSQVRHTAQLSDPATGPLKEAQRLNIERLSPQVGGDVVPMYIDLIESRPPEQGSYPEPVAAPTLSEGNHLSYAVQWFLFSGAAVIGWFLAVRHSARTRAQARSKANDAEPTHSPDVESSVV